MPAPSGMRLAALLALAGGLGFCIWLFLSHDIHAIVDLLVSIGVTGAILVVAVHVPPLLFTALAWRSLIPAGAHKPGVIRLTVIRWLGEAVNSMLPVAQVGGDVARAALLSREGETPAGAAKAGASVVADMTIALITQFFFTVLGALLFVAPGGGDDQMTGIALALILAALATGLVVLFQRAGGLRGLAKLIERLGRSDRWSKLAGGMRNLDQSLAHIYADRRATLTATVWHSLGWASHVAETWVALHVLGHPVSMTDAIIMESLVSAMRSAAFAIPGGIGAQEGAMLVLGMGTGLSAESALALALVRRLREIATGLPGLYVWWRVFGGPTKR